MRMFFIKSRKDGSIIGWPYYIEEEEGIAITYYLVGDLVNLTFYFGKALVAFLRTHPALTIPYVETDFPNHDENSRYSIMLGFQVVGRTHNLFLSQGDNLARESFHSIFLQPVDDESENILLVISKHLPPNWVKEMGTDLENGEAS